MSFSTIASLSALALVGNVTPIDGYRANVASIRAEVDYSFKLYKLTAKTIAERSDYFFKGFRVATDPGIEMPGRWACDGVAQRYAMDLVGHDPKRPDQAKGFYITPCEILFDRETIAIYSHIFEKSPIEVRPGPSTEVSRVGPLSWLRRPLSEMVEVEFSDAKVTIAKGRRGGYPVEVEVHATQIPGGWYRLEVAYDPSVNFLPRYTRLISTNEDKSATVKEYFLTDAKPCKAGGFVPLEWSMLMYDIKDFGKKYPSYTEATVLSPSGTIGYGHYLANSMRDLKGPVKLEEHPRAQTVVAKGGFIERDKLPGELTLDTLRKFLGKKLMDSPALPMVTIDSKELAETFAPPRRSWTAYAIAALIGLGLIGLIYRLRRSRFTALFLVAAGGLMGCGQEVATSAYLSASLGKTTILHDLKAAKPQALTITNDGGQTIRVFEVSGGCSCRAIDSSKWPKDLRPGESVETSLVFKNVRDFGPQHIVLEFTTDKGKLAAPIDFVAFPRHTVTPDSLSATATGEDAEFEPFEVVHREVYPEQATPEPVSLRVGAGVAAEPVAVKAGEVGYTKGYRYTDTTYRVRVRDEAMGLHKAVVTLNGVGGSTLFDLPVVWNRVAFLAAVPERVTLGERPIRVFLRCPDEAVELSAVRSAPAGVKAVISSPRELTVTLADGAPAIIDGTIEVATTAGGRPPLRVAVARYSVASAK